MPETQPDAPAEGPRDRTELEKRRTGARAPVLLTAKTTPGSRRTSGTGCSPSARPARPRLFQSLQVVPLLIGTPAVIRYASGIDGDTAAIGG